MRIIDAIVLHTAGAMDPKTGKAVHQGIETIRKYHMEHNGWSDIGYHWYVDVYGGGHRGRQDEEIGAHVHGFNTHSLGLCVSGHGDIEAWNRHQLDEVVRQCTEWCKAYGLKASAVMGHMETEAAGGPPVYKTCPGKLVKMDGIRVLVGKTLAECPAKPTLEQRVAYLERVVADLKGNR